MDIGRYPFFCSIIKNILFNINITTKLIKYIANMLQFGYNVNIINKNYILLKEKAYENN